MMINLKKNLAIFAFLAAALSAFAFNGLDPDPDSKLLAKTSSGWKDITGDVLGVDYECTEAETICTAEFNESGQMDPDTIVEGEYRPK